MFRTIEISDPQFESDNLRFVTVKTANLKGRGDICLFIPPGPSRRLEPSPKATAAGERLGPTETENQKIPLVILLHGVYGSSWSWALKADVHKTARKMIENGTINPMVIAMPSDGLWGDGSGYLPHHNLDFEKWIVEDVPMAVSEVVPNITSNSPLFISGLSMGGFGALRLGIKYQPRFAGISTHSAITELTQMNLFVEEPLDAYRQKKAAEESVWGIIQSNKGQVPPLRFDCGTDDLLIEHNRKLHHQLKEAEIDHQYQEFPGGHEWPYWQEHVKDSLLFFNRILT